MVYEGFRLRSTEVDRGRPNSRKYLGLVLDVLMDFGSSDFDRIEIFLCSIDVYGFREPADFIKLMDLLTEDGSKFDGFSSERIG